MTTTTNGIIEVIAAPEDSKHGPIYRLTPEEYSRRLEAEQKYVSQKQPKTELPRAARVGKQRFAVALENCDAALRALNLGFLITGADGPPDKPLFDRFMPSIEPELEPEFGDCE